MTKKALVLTLAALGSATLCRAAEKTAGSVPEIPALPTPISQQRLDAGAAGAAVPEVPGVIPAEAGAPTAEAQVEALGAQLSAAQRPEASATAPGDALAASFENSIHSALGQNEVPAFPVSETIDENKAGGLTVTDNIRAAWSQIMTAVAKGTGRAKSEPSAVHYILKNGIDETIQKLTEDAKTATREKAHELSSKLDWFLKGGSVTTEQNRKIRNLKTALEDYAFGRTASVVIDPVTYKDDPFQALGLIQGNSELQGDVTASFISAADAATARLSEAERLSMLRSMARTAGWGSALKVPEAVHEKLVANDEFSQFAGNVSAYALDGLAKIGTPEALAEVALQTTIGVRTSDEKHFRVSDKADAILKEASPATVAKAVDIARKALEAAPYSSDSGQASWLARRLNELSPASPKQAPPVVKDGSVPPPPPSKGPSFWQRNKNEIKGGFLGSVILAAVTLVMGLKSLEIPALVGFLTGFLPYLRLGKGDGVADTGGYLPLFVQSLLGAGVGLLVGALAGGFVSMVFFSPFGLGLRQCLFLSAPILFGAVAGGFVPRILAPLVKRMGPSRAALPVGRMLASAIAGAFVAATLPAWLGARYAHRLYDPKP